MRNALMILSLTPVPVKIPPYALETDLLEEFILLKSCGLPTLTPCIGVHLVCFLIRRRMSLHPGVFTGLKLLLLVLYALFLLYVILLSSIFRSLIFNPH